MEPQPNPHSANIRVSDHEREQVVAALGQAATEGRLTLDEYTERAGQAYAAKTRGELAQLTIDLPAAGTPAGTGMVGHRPAVPATTGDSTRLVAIFGNESRKGSWVVPAHLELQSVFGDCHIELQDAQIQHPVTTVDATTYFGSVTIFAPEGVDVRLTGTVVFGSKESKLHAPVRPGAPVIEVRVRGAFGSVTVRPPKRRWF